jgi:hypothetical protein
MGVGYVLWYLGSGCGCERSARMVRVKDGGSAGLLSLMDLLYKLRPRVGRFGGTMTFSCADY